LIDTDKDPTLRDYIRPLLRRKWFICAFVAVITAATFAYYASKPDVYKSSTKILLSPSGGPLDPSAGTLSDRDVQDQLTLLSSLDVADQVARDLDGELDAKTLRSSIDVSADSGSNFLTVTASRPTPRGAALVANAFARAFIRRRTQLTRENINAALEAAQRQLQRIPRGQAYLPQRLSVTDTIRQLQLSLATSGGAAIQVDRAVAPSSPSAPKPVRNAAIAFVVSLIGCSLLAYAVESFDRRPKRLEDYGPLLGVPMLAVVPRSSQVAQRDGRLLALGAELKEPFRQLRTNIQLVNPAKPIRTLLVTSSVEGEGKTTVVRNLALALREGGYSVAVLDCDLRRPGIGPAFGALYRPGLTDVLLGDADLDAALQHIAVQASGLGTVTRVTATEDTKRDVGSDLPSVAEADSARVEVLTAGVQPPDPQPVLESWRARELIRTLAENHDILLIDSPPMLPVTDAMSLATSADAILVVARFGRVTRDNARRLREMLSRIPGINPIGVVVNDVPSSEGGGYGYGYGYGSHSTPVNTDGSS
jgi:Mrp family chromosome partitioning ATPase/capsular polysaccharide biosynthesis protein